MALPTLKLYDSYSEAYDPALWEKLEFTSTDPCRTKLIRESDGSVQYSAVTAESGSNPITTFKDASGAVIATLEWRLYLPHKLSREGEQTNRIGKWLKVNQTSKLLKERKVTFEVDGRKYSWKGFQAHNINTVLKLYSEDEPDKAIATFNPASGPTNVHERNNQRANLMISIPAQRIKNLAVLSLLLIEKDRRFNGKTMGSSWLSGFAWMGLGGGVISS